MDNNKETMTSEEEKANHRYSFTVGIFIGLALIILFTVVSLVVH